MNILDITPADIERLKENKIVFGLLSGRDREIFGFIGTGNTDRYCSTGFYRCREGGIFQESAVYRIVSDYTLPAPTEVDIIAYLKASEVPPSQWPPVVQEWARKHQWETIWEYLNIIDRTWGKTSNLGGWSSHKHRLRADYGVKKELEVCVWKIKGFVATGCNHFYTNAIETFKPKYCPHCGKKIEIQEEE